MPRRRRLQWVYMELNEHTTLSERLETCEVKREAGNC